MSNIRSFSVEEAIAIVGKGNHDAPVNSIEWGKFVQSNIDEAFINQAFALFSRINPGNLSGLDKLCSFVAGGAEPNRMIAGGIISCRIAPCVSTGYYDDIGRLSLGCCWDDGYCLMLNSQGRDLALTWGWGRGNVRLPLEKPIYDQAEKLIQEWGDRIAGKPVKSAA